ncbi:hypothetical protein C8T65DRAFT_669500, partial [Cerioporus squamosus]
MYNAVRLLARRHRRPSSSSWGSCCSLLRPRDSRATTSSSGHKTLDWLAATGHFVQTASSRVLFAWRLAAVHHICRSTSCATSRADLGRPSKLQRHVLTVARRSQTGTHADGAAASCPRKASCCTPQHRPTCTTRLPLPVPGRSTTSGSRTAPAVADRLMPRPRLGSDVSFLTLTPHRHGVVQPASPARSISRPTRPLLDLVRAHLLRFLPARADTCQRHHLCPRSRRLPRVSVSLHCDVLQGKLELGRS